MKKTKKLKNRTKYLNYKKKSKPLIKRWLDEPIYQSVSTINWEYSLGTTIIIQHDA